ncbi:MAG: GIY-YIG nuclease family protein [Calditrichia bacterium]
MQIINDLNKSGDENNLQKGCYQLFLRLNREAILSVGRFGAREFAAGDYIYTGSHQRSLLKRIQRHLRRDKNIHWHIDYLTANPIFEIRRVLLFPGSHEECRLHQAVRKFTGGKEPIPGFGNGDCRNHCRSHLIYAADLTEETFVRWSEKNNCLVYYPDDSGK